jgi:hypothetical protein
MLGLIWLEWAVKESCQECLNFLFANGQYFLDIVFYMCYNATYAWGKTNWGLFGADDVNI